MKKMLGVLVLMLLLISASTTSEDVQNNSIEGTWELVSFYNYDELGNVSDTLPTADGYRQIKMFYNNKVMWTRYVPADSAEWFGYGSFRATDTTLVETLEYMSASMRAIANENMEWDMELHLMPDSYSQIFLDLEGNRISSENYKRLD